LAGFLCWCFFLLFQQSPNIVGPALPRQGYYV
jgi:hypothetical protein